MQLVSRREYARLRGVSEKAVRKAIAAGKIPITGEMIDVEAADASWTRNRDAGQQSKLAAAIEAQQAPAVAPPADLPPSESSPAQQPSLEMAPLTEARIQNTRESTALKEIARRKLEKSLLEAEEVERTWGEMIQVLKDRLRLLPDDDDLVSALLSCKEEMEIRSLLVRAVMRALAAMQQGIEGMVAA